MVSEGDLHSDGEGGKVIVVRGGRCLFGWKWWSEGVMPTQKVKVVSGVDMHSPDEGGKWG